MGEVGYSENVGNYLQSLEAGSSDFEINLVLIAYLFRKNIKLFYLNQVQTNLN